MVPAPGETGFMIAFRKSEKKKQGKDISLFLSIILVFCILGAVVFSVSQKISREMSASAIQNLSESLDLMKSTIEAILRKEAEFQKLLAQDLALSEDPAALVRSYEKNQAMSKISLIFSGQTEGISNTDDSFTGADLDFSSGETVDGLPVSRSYVNYMGTWAYTIKCPVVSEGRDIATLYIEYIYDSIEQSLPGSFYNGKAMLYVMDAHSERLVLKPKGMGERNAGHLNLEDFYRANNILEKDLRAEVAECVKSGRNILFYHDIRNKHSLNYMWSVGNGMLFLIGYVPVDAIQQEGRTVNQNILIVVIVMLVAFFLCCILYYFSQRQQTLIRREQEAEREIHNARLAEALQAAQIASNSKTMFLSNMSHDIRTPMNAVLGFTSLLSRDSENPAKVREYTKKITASGQHLLSLINDILDVSKIESGKVVLTFEKFTLNDLISSVDAIIRPMAKARQQIFHVEVTGIQHETLMGDETRVSQILINLLSNAVKYTPEGGIIWFRIIGLKQRSSQYERIRIEVEDNGYGMTPEYLETIFDAFTRAENSTTNKVQGTGLGMAITKNIVELMGGTIEVSSEINRGSLFKVELEFRIPEELADQKFWELNGISRILAVESDETACNGIRLLMKSTEIPVDTAADITQALQYLQTRDASARYQLILIDPETPELSASLAAAEQLRKFLPDTALILFLASCDAEPDGMEAEALPEYTGILMKPFFVSALQEKIVELRAALHRDTEPEAEETVSLAGLHFLAAEDNEINAEILTEILKAEGADCEIVENGRLALERFQSAAEGEFDAILMDVQMPVMNGYDATRAIRALERRDAAQIPVIAMTANAFAEDEKEAIAAGMNIHLAKPIDIDLLKKVILTHVSGERKQE